MTAKVCTWTLDDDVVDDPVWVTTCGNEVMFSDDSGPWRNGMRFCGYCGKPLEEMHTQPKSKDE